MTRNFKKLTTTALSLITLDSWRMALNEQEKTNRIEQEYQSKIDQLTLTNYDNEIANLSQRTKYEALAGRIQESKDEMTALQSKYDELSAKFHKVGTNYNEKTDWLHNMKRNLDYKVDLNNKITNDLKDITKDFDKNDIFGNMQQLLNDYREYLSHLDANQIGCIANSIGFVIIISSIHSLVIAYYGTIIINHFNLEVKYPKLAKIIRIRAKLTDKFIKFEILYIYITALMMLAVNIYMFYI